MKKAVARWRWLFLLLGLMVGVMGCAGTSSNTQDVLFTDAFIPGETGNWQTEGDELGTALIQNEQLVVALNTPDTIQFSTLQEPIFTDFSLEVDATLFEGAANGSYGVLFRMQESGGFYRFAVTGEGLYILERRNADGNWIRLTKGWQPSPAIHQGVNQLNRLKVVASSSNILLFVNGQSLGQFTDTQGYIQGQIGLSAGTFAQPNLTITFDNVTIRKP